MLLAELTARSSRYVSWADRWTKMLANPRLSISLRVSRIVPTVACRTRMSTSVFAGVRITLCSSSKSFTHTPPPAPRVYYAIESVKTRNAWQSPACSPLGRRKLACKTQGLMDQNFTEILSVAERSSVVLKRASKLRSCHPLWNASEQNEDVIFATATSLERWRNEGRTGHVHPHNFVYNTHIIMCILHILKIWCEDRTNTFWDNWSPTGPLKRWKKVTSVEHIARTKGHVIRTQKNTYR